MCAGRQSLAGHKLEGAAPALEEAAADVCAGAAVPAGKLRAAGRPGRWSQQGARAGGVCRGPRSGCAAGKGLSEAPGWLLQGGAVWEATGMVKRVWRGGWKRSRSDVRGGMVKHESGR